MGNNNNNMQYCGMESRVKSVFLISYSTSASGYSKALKLFLSLEMVIVINTYEHCLLVEANFYYEWNNNTTGLWNGKWSEDCFSDMLQQQCFWIPQTFEIILSLEMLIVI